MSIGPEVYVFVAIIGAIVWLLSWLLLKNRISTVSERVVLSSVIALITAPVIYVGLVVLIYKMVIYYPAEEFTSERWQAAGRRQENGDAVPPERYRYSADLISRKLLIGKTKEQVVLELGSGCADEGNRISCELGFVPGHGIDPDFLVVVFENDIAVNVIQRRS